jgi:hypothetical protein
MAKSKLTRIRRRTTKKRTGGHTLKKISGGQKLNPKISMKIDGLLILLTKKLKQDKNNKEFYTSCLELILKDIHNIKRSNDGMRGGGNLNLSLTKLLILLMTMRTGLSSQMVVRDSHLAEYKNELKETRDIHDIAVVPGFEKYLFFSETDNVAKYKITNRIVSAVDSLNKHYTTMISGKKSELSSASKITNLCRDVFLGSDVQKILLSPKPEPASIYTLYTNTPTVSEKTDDVIDDINFDTICELSFPIPRLFIDKDQILKVEVTKSISYKKIADMLETLYKGINSDNLDHEVNIKISKLKYLIKGIRYIEDSSREFTDFESKVHNVHERITDYFSTFEEIENMFGDPELHFESVRKGLQNAFDTRLMDQQTSQNEIKVRSYMNSFISPFYSGVSSVTDSSIEYFTSSVNSVISGFNLDKHFYMLVFCAMGTLVTCVAVRTSKKGKNNSNEIEELKKQIQILTEQNTRRAEKKIQRAMNSRQQRVEQIPEQAMNSRQQGLEEQILQQAINSRLLMNKVRRPSCPDGQKYNKKTGECEERTKKSRKKYEDVITSN